MAKTAIDIVDGVEYNSKTMGVEGVLWGIDNMLQRYMYVKWVPEQQTHCKTMRSKLKSEIDSLTAKERDYAQYYTDRFIDYMNFNAPSKFPEYYSNNNEDIYPDKDSTYSGWVL